MDESHNQCLQSGQNYTVQEEVRAESIFGESWVETKRRHEKGTQHIASLGELNGSAQAWVL